MSKIVLALCCSLLIVILMVIVYFIYYKKVDCELHSWKVGNCITSSSCGDGLITFTRSIKTKPKNGGKSCDSLIKTENCKIECPPPLPPKLTDTQKAIKVYTLTYDMFPNIVLYVATTITKCGYLITGLSGYSVTDVKDSAYIINDGTIQYIGNIRAVGLYYKIRFVGGSNDGKYLTIDSSTFGPTSTNPKSIRVNPLLSVTEPTFFWKATEVKSLETDSSAISLLLNF